MGKEMRTLNRDLLVQAEKDLVHSGGTPYGQSCHFEADVWHELLALLRTNLRGDAYCIEAPIAKKGRGDA